MFAGDAKQFYANSTYKSSEIRTLCALDGPSKWALVDAGEDFEGNISPPMNRQPSSSSSSLSVRVFSDQAPGQTTWENEDRLRGSRDRIKAGRGDLGTIFQQ